MLNKYTIIDNFDKLDIAVFETPGDEFNIRDSYAGSPPTMTFQFSPHRFREIINFGYVSSADNATVTAINKFFHRPIAFTPFMRLLPDMARYMTGYKFFVNKDGTLIYPPSFVDQGWEVNETFPRSVPTVFGPFYSMEQLHKEAPKMDFDLLNVEDSFNTNANLFGNSLKFEDYYSPTLLNELDFIPPWLLGGQPLQACRAILKQHRQFQTGQHGPWWTTLGDNLGIDYVRNNIIFNLSPETLMLSFLAGDIKFFTSLKNVPKVKQLQELFINAKLYREILQKLLKMYRMTGQMKIVDGKLVNTLQNISRHTYFVADLPRGTKDLPLIDHDNNTSTPPVNALDYIVNEDVVTINSKYNYYAEYSEKYPENVTMEWQLPNLYTYYSLQTEKSDYFKKLITLDTQLPSSDLVQKVSVKKYYDIIANSSGPTVDQLPWYMEIPEDTAFPTDFNVATYYRYKTIVIDNKNFLNEANAIAKLFPMYNEVKIPSKNSEFMTGLKNTKNVNRFVTLLANYFSSYGNPESAVHSFVMHTENPESFWSHGWGLPRHMGVTSDLQIMDVAKIFNSAAAIGNYEKYFSGDKYVEFGSKKITGPLEGDDISNTVKLYAIKNDILEFIENKKLTLKNIYEGKKCHTEPLVIEIAKYKHSSEYGDRHIQSIFLPCLYEGKETSYIDTQVFYEEKYSYRIYIHSLIIGSKYWIDRKGTKGQDSDHGLNVLIKGEDEYIETGTANIENFINEAAPIIVRAPYYNTPSMQNLSGEQLTKIVDKPPLPPDIVFRPYKDDDEKILVSLNINYGKRNLVPITVFEEDIEKNKKYLKEQKDLTLKQYGYVSYKTDDTASKYQIYRTTQKPDSWTAFANANLKELGVKEGSGYDDYILSNTDYYYFARCIDVHENISNPTNIFYVRIVKEEGFPPYLITHVYNFSEAKKAPKYSKSFKKYLKIRLADGTRTLINPEKNKKNTNNILDNTLGYKKAPSPGGTPQLKKYKIRIISKKTGKKIDLNLDFTNTTNDIYVIENKLSSGLAVGAPIDDGSGDDTEVVVENENKKNKDAEVGDLLDDNIDPPAL